MLKICHKNISMNIKLESSWKNLLSDEFEAEYFKNIKSFLKQEIESWKIIYPHPSNIFAAFEATSLDNLKVVILGQDPYHGQGQAHGLSFSVQDGVKVPPSLKNMYKEIKNEYPDFEIPVGGNLEHWAKQGVLMLNSILTVEASKPASHSKIGWEKFTDAVIKNISEHQEWIIFLLWGNFSRGKKSLIDTSKHFVLESPHPSPFSAHSWFFGNNHFKKANEILKKEGKKEITW